MGRKNRRRQQPKHNLPLPELEQKLTSKKDICCRCAYCGIKLYSGEWHWMWDEFGQRVRKCNDERRCATHRRDISEESFRRAMKL